MILNDVIVAMKQAGCGDADIGAVAAILVANPRKSNAERQSRYRAKSIRNVTVTPFSNATVTRYSNVTKEAPSSFPPVSPPPGPTPPITPQSSSQENRARAEKFEEFWKIWPNKVGKPAARKSFDQISRQANGSWEALFDSIIEGVGRYSREKPPDRSWLNPATFLNQRRWDDQPAPVSAPRGSAREKRDPFGKIIENAWREKNGLPTVDESARIFGPEPNASDPLEPFSLQP